ncbi:glycoside hydrolase family 16 protein [Flavilitoribacter nigricans]|nr:glycoside hydrolase family 16 protein [Flavilitoribacter nigricans]
MKSKIYFNMFFLLLLTAIFPACEEDLSEIAAINAPTNLMLTASVMQDGSGLVNFDASAEGAMVYHYYLGVSAGERPVVSSDGNLDYAYRSSGDYTVNVVAYGPGGAATNATTEISVEVTYEPPTDLVAILTGGSSRNWLWDKAEPGHLGVGPLADDGGNPVGEPIWYMAQPFEKESEGCLYNDVMTFSLNGDNTISYTLNNQGITYFNRGEVNAELGAAVPDADRCYDYETSGSSSVGFFESDSGIPTTTDISFTIGNNGFVSYFLGSNTYEIISYSEDEIYLRTIQTDDGGAQFAWYQRLIAEDAEDGDPVVEYEEVWADEFNTDGAPNADNWTYDLGTGDNGWGNGEAQFYTDRAENVYVDNGTLKIVAKRENYNGTQFTSTRLKTEDKFEFTYGKIEVRAKLPNGGGTWPAIWMLGADYQTNTWPACGEMDIMEHVGNNQNVVQAAIHTPSSFGDTENKASTTVNGVSDDFHVYELEWTADALKFSVDGNNFYTYEPEVKDASTYPFNKDFFLILNVAIGGALGGEIDNTFTEGVMEVDYVRVYQQK